jgi:hypothetical protein
MFEISAESFALLGSCAPESSARRHVPPGCCRGKGQGAEAATVRIMAKLIYAALTSLDGYVADEAG